MNKNIAVSSSEVTVLSRPAFYWTLADALVVARRQLRQIPRTPDELVASTIQPVITLVIFRYLLGGAISVPGSSYINYLVAGIFVQSVLFGSASVGIGVASDVHRGLVDRFRSLPMATSAILTGRIVADQVRSALIIVVTWLFALLFGFRPEGSWLAWLGASALLLLISFVFAWLSALIGLLLNSVEAVQQAGLIWLLPFAFGSSAFVPVNTLPNWLQAFADHQPVSLAMDAVRGLLLNQVDPSTIWTAIIWFVGLLIVIIPVAVWAYRRRTAH